MGLCLKIRLIQNNIYLSHIKKLPYLMEIILYQIKICLRDKMIIIFFLLIHYLLNNFLLFQVFVEYFVGADFDAIYFDVIQFDQIYFDEIDFGEEGFGDLDGVGQDELDVDDLVFGFGQQQLDLFGVQLSQNFLFFDFLLKFLILWILQFFYLSLHMDGHLLVVITDTTAHRSNALSLKA